MTFRTHSRFARLHTEQAAIPLDCETLPITIVHTDVHFSQPANAFPQTEHAKNRVHNLSLSPPDPRKQTGADVTAATQVAKGTPANHFYPQCSGTTRTKQLDHTLDAAAQEAEISINCKRWLQFSFPTRSQNQNIICRVAPTLQPCSSTSFT